MHIGNILLGLLVTVPVTAQGPEPHRPTPAKPLLTLEMDGLEALRQGFLPTNFGTLLASQDARGIWPELWDRFNRTWYGKGEPEPLIAYGGRIRVLGFIEPGHPQKERGIVVFEPDGKTSLDRLGEELSTWLRSGARGAPVDREVGTLHLKSVDRQIPGTITLPQVIDGRLVSLFGQKERMDWAIEEGLKDLEALPPASRGEEPTLSLRLDLQQAAVLIREDAGTDEFADMVFGLDSWRELVFTLRPAGPRVLAEIGVRFGEEERGLFAGLMPEIDEKPSLVSLVPEESEWFAGHLRIDSLVRTGLTFLGLAFRHGAAPADPLAEAREEIRKKLGFDLFDDLLVHLGDEVLVIRSPEPLPQPWRIEDFFSGLCLGVAVRNSDVVEKNLLRLLQEMELRGTGAREYRGVRVRELPYPDGSGSAHLAVMPELLLLGFGEGGLASLEDVLEARSSQKRHVPMAVKRALRGAPEGLNGMGVVGVGTSAWLAMPMLEDVLDLRGGFGAGSVVPMGLLERYGLGDVVVFTGASAAARPPPAPRSACSRSR